MRKAVITGLCCGMLMITPAVYAERALDREQAILESMDRIEGRSTVSTEPVVVSSRTPVEPSLPADAVLSPEGEGLKLTPEASIGYLGGTTSYDWNYHTSQLDFPMGNWMLDLGAAVDWQRWSLTGSVMFPLNTDAGYNMRDRDWTTEGLLFSDTHSQANVNAVIADLGFRYDIMRRTLNAMESIGVKQDDQLRVGLLAGYRYERFDYDIRGVYYDTDLIDGWSGEVIGTGTDALSYEIEYFLPYIGLAADVSRGKFDLGVSLKYSVYPTARQTDNHLLRALQTHAMYDRTGSAWMGSVTGTYHFDPQWSFKGGVDFEYVRINGMNSQTNSDAEWDPAWNNSMSTDMAHWFIHGGLKYTF